MKPELRERRIETWDLLVVKGLDYSAVVTRISQNYDITESGVKQDIARMDDWLPKLDDATSSSAISRLRELRQNRQRYQQMALEARRDGDLEKELKIRRRIDKGVELDVSLSQSVGETAKEPDKHDVDMNVSPDEALMASLKSAYDEQGELADDGDGNFPVNEDGEVDPDEW